MGDMLCGHGRGHIGWASSMFGDAGVPDADSADGAKFPASRLVVRRTKGEVQFPT
jgi:hypothetical protein